MKNLNTNSLIENYQDFAEPTLQNRFCKHEDIIALIAGISETFQVAVAGYSVEGRSLNLISWGRGPIKVFLWSQMHGDEATGTMALFDLINFLQCDQYTEEGKHLAEQCTLYLLPMVNPDGAARFTRRNAIQIDINRDFLKAVSAEAQILKKIQADLKPHFGFNLHDQNTLWSVTGSKLPATLSYLAPAFDEGLSISDNRSQAMLVIAGMFSYLSTHIPGQIGLFDDEYEPRAFGDNFQRSGTATILIEAGGLKNDPEKQEIRKYYFLSILTGLWTIANGHETYSLKDYADIPKNTKQIFHTLIHRVILKGVEVSIGLNYDEICEPGTGTAIQIFSVQDIGDMDELSAYQVYDATDLTLHGEVIFDQIANFELRKSNEIILSFKNGILDSKL
jgi:hypothetical protein